MLPGWSKEAIPLQAEERSPVPREVPTPASALLLLAQAPFSAVDEVQPAREEEDHMPSTPLSSGTGTENLLRRRGRAAALATASLALLALTVLATARRSMPAGLESVQNLAATGAPMVAPAAISSAANLLQVWNLTSGHCLRNLTGHASMVYAVAADFALGRAISASIDGALKVWDLASGRCLKTFSGHRKWPVAVAADFAQGRAISASADKSLKVWDLASGRCLKTLLGHTDAVLAVAADFARGRAISASDDRSLRLWDLATGLCLKTLTGHTDSVLAVAADFVRGQAISASVDKSLKVWDMASGGCLRTLMGHTDGSWAVAADFSRGRAISASHDDSLKVWDLADGRCLTTLTGHTDGVDGVAADFTLGRALSASADRSLKLWDLASGRCLRSLAQFADGVGAVVADFGSGCPPGWLARPGASTCSEGFRFSCLSGAKLRWIPRRLVHLSPNESKTIVVQSQTGLRLSSSVCTEKAAPGAERGIGAELGAEISSGSCGSLIGLSPLCSVMGEEAADILQRMLYPEREEGASIMASETTGVKCPTAVKGERRRCKLKLTAPGKRTTYQIWQRSVRLVYSHRVLNRRQSVSLELLVPSFIHTPYRIGLDHRPIQPGTDYGVMPSPLMLRNGCFPKPIIEAIAGTIGAAPCV